MACPDVHLCDNPKCFMGTICLEQKIYLGRKLWKEQQAAGLTKKDTRKLRKAAKKAIGRRRFCRDEKTAIKAIVYSDTPHCVKNREWCDKKEACSVLNRCVVDLCHVKSHPELLEALRGPHRLKEIIRLLAKYNPTPMKSWYRKNGQVN